MGSSPCLGTWKNPIGMGLKKMGWVAIRVILGFVLSFGETKRNVYTIPNLTYQIKVSITDSSNGSNSSVLVIG